MALYMLDGLSWEMIARRFRTERAEWALRIWLVIAWATAIFLVWGWLVLSERRSLSRKRPVGRSDSAGAALSG